MSAITNVFKRMSKARKMGLTVLLFAYVLMIYAIGCVTNFWGQPIFSAFFIISQNEAHTVVALAAALIAVPLAVTGIYYGALKNRNILDSAPRPHKKPTTSTAAKTWKMAKADPKSRASPKVNNKPEMDPPAQQIAAPVELVQQNIGEPRKRSPASKKPASAPIVQQEADNTTSYDQVKEHHGKLVCPHCHKGFTQPIFTLDFSGSSPKLKSVCPYCFQTVKSEKGNIKDQEDMWKRAVRNST